MSAAVLGEQFQCRDAVARLADDLMRKVAGDVGQQVAQPRARRCLVIHDQQAGRTVHPATRRGRSTRTR